MTGSTLNLREYVWNGSSYVESDATLGILKLIDDSTYDSKRYLCIVRDMKKTESRAWRIRQTMSSYVARAKIKEKVEIKYSITGTCNGNKRNEMDFYARRKSKFRCQGGEEIAGVDPSVGAWMSSPIVNGGIFNYSGYADQNSEEYSPAQRFFVVIESVSFSKSEGKAVFGENEKDLYDFTLELTRVDTGNVVSP